MSNVKISAMQAAQPHGSSYRWLDSPMNTTDYIGPYATYMDKKNPNKQTNKKTTT